MSVLIRLSEGVAEVGGRQVPVEAVDGDRLRVGGPTGPVLRPISFTERLVAAERALLVDDSTDELIAAVRRLATVDQGRVGDGVDDGAVEALALHLAGAGSGGPSFAECAVLAARVLGWGPRQLDEANAGQVDRLAGQLRDATAGLGENGWQRIVFDGSGPVGEADPMRVVEALADDLLARAIDGVDRALLDAPIAALPDPEEPMAGNPWEDPWSIDGPAGPAVGPELGFAAAAADAAADDAAAAVDANTERPAIGDDRQDTTAVRDWPTVERSISAAGRPRPPDRSSDRRGSEPAGSEPAIAVVPSAQPRPAIGADPPAPSTGPTVRPPARGLDPAVVARTEARTIENGGLGGIASPVSPSRLLSPARPTIAPPSVGFDNGWSPDSETLEGVDFGRHRTVIDADATPVGRSIGTVDPNEYLVEAVAIELNRIADLRGVAR